MIRRSIVFALVSLVISWSGALSAGEASSVLGQSGGGGSAPEAQGDVTRSFPADWEPGVVGLAIDHFDPSRVLFFHESGANGGTEPIWSHSRIPPFEVMPVPVTTISSAPDFTGGSVLRDNGDIYAADFLGDLIVIDDYIQLFDRFGNTKAFWETDVGLSGPPCAGGAIDGIIDVSTSPIGPGFLYATSNSDNLIYSVDVSDTSGGPGSPSPCLVLGAVSAPAVLTNVGGIEVDLERGGFWLSSMANNTILLVADDGTFATVLETLNADGGGGFNSGVTPQSERGSPTPLWVTDFGFDSVAIVDSGSFDDCNVPGNPIADCGFESGAFAPNWVATDAVTPHIPLAIFPSGFDPGFGFFFSDPTEGAAVAGTGFDAGSGPDTIQIAQDVALPPNATQLWFDYRAAWDMFNFVGSTLPRDFTVNIEPPGGGPPIQTNLVLQAPPGTVNFDTGDRTGWVDVAPFAGAVVRLAFDAFIPEVFTGPGFLQLDNIEVKGPRPLQQGDLIASTGQIGGTLLELDPSSGLGTPRFPHGIFGPVTEIEFRDDGMLFAAVGQGISLILTIDPDTGVERVIGPHTFDAFNGLEFVGDVLYGTGTVSGNLVTIDQTTGLETIIGPLGLAETVAGLAYDETTGIMYGSTNVGNLATINLATGAGTFVGPTGFDRVTALEFGPDGVLYGGLGQAATTNPGELITIDPGSGTATLVGPSGFPGISGLAFHPGVFLGTFELGNTNGWGGGNGVTCTHDKCDEGLPLGPLCDPCVAQICAVDPYCCEVAWDAFCVDEVLTICGITCP